MARSRNDPPQDFDEDGNREVGDERLKLLRTANKLTLSFAAWAIVVGIVGALAIIMLSRMWSEQDNHEVQSRLIEANMRGDIASLRNELILIRERQDVVIRRLDRLDDRLEKQK